LDVTFVENSWEEFTVYLSPTRLDGLVFALADRQCRIHKKKVYTLLKF